MIKDNVTGVPTTILIALGLIAWISIFFVFKGIVIIANHFTDEEEI